MRGWNQHILHASLDLCETCSRGDWKETSAKISQSDQIFNQPISHCIIQSNPWAKHINSYTFILIQWLGNHQPELFVCSLKNASVFTIRSRVFAAIGICRDVDQTIKSDAARRLSEELFSGFGQVSRPNSKRNTVNASTCTKKMFCKCKTKNEFCK